MPAQVEGHGPPAVGRHGLGRPAPGVTGLSPTVEKEHRPGVGITSHVGHQVHALEPVEHHSLHVHHPMVAEARAPDGEPRRSPGRTAALGPIGYRRVGPVGCRPGPEAGGTMEHEQARALLAAERSRVERLLDGTLADGRDDRSAANQGGDMADPAERLTAEEGDDAVTAELRERLAAIARAESPAGEWRLRLFGAERPPHPRRTARGRSGRRVDCGRGPGRH